MRKLGANKEQTMNTILRCAKQEFYEKGYINASLRNICKMANVTTGAVYCFFNGKQELFNLIVSNVLSPLKEHMLHHYHHQCQYLNKYKSNDLEADKMVADFIFKSCILNKKIWSIILHNINQPYIQSQLNDYIEVTTNHCMKIIDIVIKHGLTNRKVDYYKIHSFVNMQLYSLLYLPSLDVNEEQLKSTINTTIKMLKAAFNTLLIDV